MSSIVQFYETVQKRHFVRRQIRLPVGMIVKEASAEEHEIKSSWKFVCIAWIM